MTYLNNNYGIVKFEKAQNYKISEKNGLYRIIALPISFSYDNRKLMNDYLKFFKNFSISNWENSISSNTIFNNSNIIVDLTKSFEKDILNFLNKKDIDWSNNEINFDNLKNLVHFLPPLYIGKAKEQLKTLKDYFYNILFSNNLF